MRIVATVANKQSLMEVSSSQCCITDAKNSSSDNEPEGVKDEKRKEGIH